MSSLCLHGLSKCRCVSQFTGGECSSPQARRCLDAAHSDCSDYVRVVCFQESRP
ncbi:hypothetical protein BC835DRAFT_1352259 [Cytidiella melzeri]|nr:hypothetical protein BC835DRAFT_1352259 [Cytidiella melzeri]